MSRAALLSSGYHVVATWGMNDSQKVTRSESRQGRSVLRKVQEGLGTPSLTLRVQTPPIEKSLTALLTVSQPCDCHCHNVLLGYVCGLLVTN